MRFQFLGNSSLHVLMGTMLLLAGCAQGEYRMPYENGTVVEVVNDHVTHSSPKAYMYDIKAQNPTPAAIVAAAPGWVRFIDDSHEEPTNDNNYVWIEHPYPFCPVDASRANWPGKPANYDATCIPCDRDFCNEWTTYAHMTKNSVRVDAGLSEGDWVEAGDFLGYEDEVGWAMHWRASPLARGGHPTGHGANLQRLLPGLRQRHRAATGGHPDRVSRRVGGACSGEPARTRLPAAPPQRRGRRDRSCWDNQSPGRPLAAVLQRIASISDEGIWIALEIRGLMLKTRQLMARMEPRLPGPASARARAGFRGGVGAWCSSCSASTNAAAARKIASRARADSKAARESEWKAESRDRRGQSIRRNRLS